MLRVLCSPTPAAFRDSRAFNWRANVLGLGGRERGKRGRECDGDDAHGRVYLRRKIFRYVTALRGSRVGDLCPQPAGKFSAPTTFKPAPSIALKESSPTSPRS